MSTIESQAQSSEKTKGEVSSEPLSDQATTEESLTVQQPTYRKDYKRPPYTLKHADLYADLYDDDTQVTGKLTISKSKEVTESSDLILHGDSLTCLSVSVNDKPLNEAAGEYSITAEGNLIIPLKFVPVGVETFIVTTKASFSPAKNLQLMGLYKSGQMFSTQCEATGFRRITYFIDRPDVMSKYTVHIEADKEQCPVLLCNGNLVSKVDCPTNIDRHIATFDDPFPKPSYLFALVAGKLDRITDTFTTMSGKKVTLNLFSDPGDSERLRWALNCVKMAMKWDEETFGREYDLEIFNVVSARDFNMGAMENKGLNIFNASYLLASEKISTDAEFQLIASVIGHEYFHNWTGNRVTVRDWFQVTLKEGLTNFREQIFSETIYSSVVKRIEDVSTLRSHQFAEDNSPLRHPIRPESYISMDNFYTVTVYNKGAEVIRMYRTLLGVDGFRKGMDLYFERHDGKAVTCDDFRAAMADANSRDLAQFELWYLQSGTPVIEVENADYNKQSKKYSFTLRQSIPSQGDKEGKAQHIPVAIGLIGKQSQKDLLDPPTQVLELKEFAQVFEFEVAEEPFLSVLRNFSAPVKVKYDQTDEDLTFQMIYDTDDFNRWEAGQKLSLKYILQRAEKCRGVADFSAVIFEPLPATYVAAFKKCLVADMKDKSSLALLISLPDTGTVMQEMKPADPVSIHFARQSVKLELCKTLKNEMNQIYNDLTKPDDYEETLSDEDMSRRRLRNVLLNYLVAGKDAAAGALAYQHFQKGKNMTDKLAGLQNIVDIACNERDAAIQEFFDYAKGDAIVIDKWFSAQARADREDIVQCATNLMQHKDFDFLQPNRFRSLVSVFASNITAFHKIDGSGYKFVADAILKVDLNNSQVSARLCRCFQNYKIFDDSRAGLMKDQLIRMKNSSNLSVDLKEILTISLG